MVGGGYFKEITLRRLRDDWGTTDAEGAWKVFKEVQLNCEENACGVKALSDTGIRRGGE